MACLDDLVAPTRALRVQFDQYVEPYRETLWCYCLRLTASAWDAEDLVQDTLLRAFGHLAMIGQALNPKAYLFRMASNTWLDQCRRQNPSTELDRIEEAEAAPVIDFVEVTEAVQMLVQQLPPRQRVVFLLVEAFNFRPVEIAEMLSTTEGAIKALVHRARATVRSHSGVKNPPAISPSASAPPEVVRQYIEAFNRRDLNALFALFHQSAVQEVVGDWEERGVEAMQGASFAAWAASRPADLARISELDGRDLVLVFTPNANGGQRLSSVIRLEIRERLVVRQMWYFWCPELLRYTAERFAMEAETHGYHSPE